MAHATWFKSPRAAEISRTLNTLSRRRRGWLLAFGLLIVVSLFGLLTLLNNHFSVIIPAEGGRLREGLIGSPLFVNPVLAASDTDRDVTALIYSGLMRLGAEGQLVPDLAEKYEISDDGLIYDFTLRGALTWHDGQALTTDDIVFTIQKAQDPLVKSPRRASWEGVRVEKVDERQIRFHLKQPFPSFLETTTMGILPRHLWNNFNPERFLLNQFNTEAIGSGPYRIRAIKRNNQGIAEYYDLVAFNHFATGRPFIDELRLRFYPNESELVAAYRHGEIDSLAAISAQNAHQLASEGARVERAPLTRVFGVFFNQNEAPIFADSAARRALEAAIDRETLIDAVLRGYGQPATGPLPSATLASTSRATTTASTASERLAAAKNLLEDGGWEWQAESQRWQKKGGQELTFSLATSDAPELKATAEILRDTWTALGTKVDLKIFEIGDLNKDVIRPRKYDALFFGQILGRTPDLFSFWASSQRLDPGYNIALYANLGVDRLLDELRGAKPDTDTSALYRRLSETISADTPAIFLYSPDFLYLAPSKIKNLTLPPITTPSDRFATLPAWHIGTDKVWKIFTKQSVN